MPGCDYVVDKTVHRKYVTTYFNANIGDIVRCSYTDHNIVRIDFESLFNYENKVYRQMSEGAGYDEFVEIAK